MLKKNVLRKKSDFSSIYNKGKSVGDRFIVLFYRKNNLSYNRTGFLASKKVGNSVVRHRLTRLIRESYRLNEKKFDDGLDLVIIARPGAKERNFFEIESALLHLCSLHGIMKKADGKEVEKEDEESNDLSD